MPRFKGQVATFVINSLCGLGGNLNPTGAGATFETGWSSGGHNEITAFFPNAGGEKDYSVDVVEVKFEAVSTCPSTRVRTSLGLRELVDFWTVGDVDVYWSASSGSMSTEGAAASSSRFTAPGSPTQATVTASLENVSVPVTFDVTAPTGVEWTWLTQLYYGDEDPEGSMMGAGNKYRGVLQPTDRSFQFIQAREWIHPWSLDFLGTEYDIEYSQAYAVSFTTPISACNEVDDDVAVAGIPVECGAADSGEIQVELQYFGNDWVSFETNNTHRFIFDANGRGQAMKNGMPEGEWMGPWIPE